MKKGIYQAKSKIKAEEASTVGEINLPNLNENILWLDALKVFSIIAVIVLHVSAVLITGITETSSVTWWTANVFNASVRWAVPVFVMVSGALLLDPSKKESFIEFYTKRFNRIFIPLVFWTLAYYIFYSRYDRDSRFIVVFLSTLMGKPLGAHLWFIYMLLGLYLFTPFIRSYVPSSSDKERYYLIVLLFSFAGLVSFLDYFFLNGVLNNTRTIFSLFIPYLGYFICGYQLKQIDKSNVSYGILISTMLSCFVATFIGAGFATNEYGMGYNQKLWMRRNKRTFRLK